MTASGADLNAPGNTQTADEVVPKVKKIGSLDEFFPRSAFTPVTEARFGNTGRNILRGPGVVNLDLSVFRDVPITERYNLQFRAEAFNLSNTPHFNNPDSSVNSGNFMRIRSAVQDQGTIRFGLRLSF